MGIYIIRNTRPAFKRQLWHIYAKYVLKLSISSAGSFVVIMKRKNEKSITVEQLEQIPALHRAVVEMLIRRGEWVVIESGQSSTSMSKVVV